MPDIDYNKQTFATPNPIARFAHHSRLKFSLAMVGDTLPHHGRLLDFGCGAGMFLRELKRVRPDAELLGYEPYLEPGNDGFERIALMNSIPASSIHVVSALEVLEHLSDDALRDFQEEAQRILVPDGVLVISVPIIGGLTLFLKETNRMVLFRRRSEYGLMEFLRAAFLGVPGERPVDRGPTHKGFDFRAIRRMLASTFQLQSEKLSPFAVLPWWLNSQIFLVLRKRSVQ